MARDELTGAASAPPEEKVTLLQILKDPVVRLVMVVVFVVMLGFGLVLPTLPLYAKSFGVSYETASLVVSAFALTRLVTDPVSGPIVGRWGERLSATLGLFVVGVSSFLAGLAPNFPMLVLLRGVGGAGSAILFAALYSYLLKVIPKHRMGRTLSLFFGTFNVGIIAGTPLGGWIAESFGLNSPLFVYAGLCILGGILYWRLVPDPKTTGAVDDDDGDPSASHLRRTIRTVRNLVRDRAFVTTIAVNMAYFWMVAGVYDYLVPLFGSDGLGMSPRAIGLAFAVAVTTELIVLYPAGVATDRSGRKAVLVPSLILLAISIVAVGWAGSPLMFVILMAVLGVAAGYAGVPPSAMLSDVVPEQRSATAVGLFRFAGDLGFVLGPYVAGISLESAGLGFKGAFAVAAVPVVAALLLVLASPETLASKRTDRRPAATPSG